MKLSQIYIAKKDLLGYIELYTSYGMESLMAKNKQLKINFGYPIIVFDTETGGLNPEDVIEFSKDPDLNLAPGDPIQGVFVKDAAPILEIGAIRLNPITLEEEDYFHAFCGAEEGETVRDLFNRCDPEALKVNNLGEDDEIFKNADPCSKVLNDFTSWITKVSGRVELAGQNVRYDIDMVNAALREHGVDYEMYSSPLELQGYSKLYFALPDTPVVANYQLTTVAEALGINTENAHTALADVRMTAECMRIMCSRFGL